MNYFCLSETCTFKGEGPYRLTLPAEACIDEHNCAVVFCPYCRGKMTIARPGDPPPRRG